MCVILKFEKPTGIGAGRSQARRFKPGGIGADEPGGRSPSAGTARDRERATPSEFDCWQPFGAVFTAIVGSGERDSLTCAPRSAYRP